MRAPLGPWQSQLVVSGGKAASEFYDFLAGVEQALKPQAPGIQTASYTLVEQDADRPVETSVGSANNLTVPPSSAVAFDIGTRIKVTQAGAGQTTIVPGSGVTVRSRIGLKLAGQWAVGYLDKRGNDEWVASGDLTT